MPKIGLERVTVKDVWTDTAYLGPIDLARELSFRIEAGSTKRPDANKKIDQANTLMASVGQPALQLGDFATYNRVLTALYESQGTPNNMRILLTPPPPPMPAPPGGRRRRGAEAVSDGLICPDCGEPCTWVDAKFGGHCAPRRGRRSARASTCASKVVTRGWAMSATPPTSSARWRRPSGRATP